MAKRFGSGIEDLVRRRVKRVALASGSTGAFAFAWQNPESKAIMVTRMVVDITTAGGTGSSVLDIGKVASATATASDIFNDINLDTIAVTDHL